ncbi:hypothetical protein [Mycobacterium colombiense]
MADLRTDWTDNIGMQVDAAFLNSLDTAVNTNTHARTLTGNRSALPAAAAGNNGAVYECTDCDARYMSNGSAWSKLSIGGLGGPPMADPPSSGWTGVNMQTGSSFAADADSQLFTIAQQAVTPPNLQYQYRAYPGTPFTLTTYIDAVKSAIDDTSWAACGIVLSDGTKDIVFGPQYGAAGVGQSDKGWNVWAAKLSTNTAYSAFYNAWPVNRLGMLPKWYRVVDDGTNLTFKCSVNGKDWTTIGGPEARTSFLTPSRIGVGGTNTTGSSLLMRLRSWNVA